jgi:hypothetical protein
MTTVLPFSNNTIQVYAYEGFNYTISNVAGYTLQPVSSGGLNAFYFTQVDNSSYIFSSSDLSNNLTAGTVQSFVLTTVSGTDILTSSNTVNINAGRFLDGCGNSLSNNSYVFYKNEPIPPITLVAPSFTLKTPTSVPFLPPGLSFVRDSSSIFKITGTPTVTVPNSNYQIIGVQQGGSKVVTTRINMAVSNERLRMNLSGTPIISGMQIGTAIGTRVITSVPPVGSSTVTYTFPAFPNGIVATDLSGITKTSPFTPTDPSYTMIISGTPTVTAANFFRDSGSTDASGIVYTVRGSRTVPLPILENSQALTFAFGETVLFDTPVLSNNFTGIPIDGSLNYFGARTYFTASNAPITNIFSSNLASVDPSLSLVFDASLSRAYLIGTTSVAGTKNFNIRAVNANLTTRDLSASVTISNDAVVFSSPVGDVCVNYILSRPVDQFKTGYYESNVQFVATANSGRPITLSAPGLVGTGLSLSSNGTIVGTPTTVTSLFDLSVTASTGTVSNTKAIKLAILNDVITLGDVSASKLNFVQNIPITPFQIPVNPTLSGRNIINFSEVNLPAGLSINPAGIMSGTCLDSDLSGTITITASTGFASGSKNYDFTNEPDTILFTVPQDEYVYEAGDNVVIPVSGVAYSGATVSNYGLTLDASYGLSIGSTSGLVSGQWTDSIPPNKLLPASCNFNITAQAGSVAGVLPASFTANPIIQNTSFVWASGRLFVERDGSWNASTGISNTISNAFDIQLRNNKVDGNTILFTAGQSIYRTTNSAVFNEVVIGNSSNFQYVSSVTPKPRSTTWWASGTGFFEGDIQRHANILRTDDNGLTWNPVSKLISTNFGSERELYSRDANLSVFSALTNPYLCSGIALKYKDDVLIAGGFDPLSESAIMRSTDEGLTWNTSIGATPFTECAYLNLDVSGMWIATGGSWTLGTPEFGTPTILVSTDKGESWSFTMNDFNVNGYELVYGNNYWMATGVSFGFGGTYSILLKHSSNGVTWTDTDLSSNNLFGPQIERPIAPLPLGSLHYDGSNWNVFVQRQNVSFDWVSEIYRSPTPLGPWVVEDVTSRFIGVPNDIFRRFVTYTPPNYLRTSRSKIIDINLTFDTNLGGGPTITSPASLSFLTYQYISVSIPLFASGVGIIYFFIAADGLPPGLTFNPSTNTISGKPAAIGNFTTPVFVKDDNGVTQTSLFFTVNVPRVIRKQDGAGAYTYLLRQYTEVLGAQNARDNRALPNQEQGLGAFMSPQAPDVITQPFTTTKCAVCKRAECPTIIETVDSGDVDVAVCDFIDANTEDQTNAIDAGNAEPNVCD